MSTTKKTRSKKLTKMKDLKKKNDNTKNYICKITPMGRKSYYIDGSRIAVKKIPKKIVDKIKCEKDVIVKPKSLKELAGAKKIQSRSSKAGRPKGVKNKPVKPLTPIKDVIQSKEPKQIGKCISRSKVALRPHQIKAVHKTRKYRGTIAWLGVGTGKTLTAITASQCYLEDNPKGKVVFVAPASLIENAKKEMSTYGIKSTDKRYSFYTYAKFAKDYQDSKKCENKMIIFDEAHNLRTVIEGKKTSVAFKALQCAIKSEKLLFLTATPLYNEPYDIVNLAAMIRGENVPVSRSKFQKIINNKKEFAKYFKCMFEYFETPKDENYPSVQERYQILEMSNKYYKAYRKIELGESTKKIASNPFMFLHGIRRATNNIKDCVKCDWIVKRLKEKKLKTIIYSSFLGYGIELLKKRMDAEGIKYLEVTGKLTKPVRAEAVKKFNTRNSGVQVLLITKAGGEGLDLKETREVIIMESVWNRPAEEQIIGRAVRYKSHINLPEKERRVEVIKLLLDKPKKRDKEDKLESADVIIKDMVEKKTKENEEFINQLKQLIKSEKC